MEIEHGKPKLTTVTALSTSGLLRNGVCLRPFSQITEALSQASFLWSTRDPPLPVVGFVLPGVPKVMLGDLSGTVAFGQWGGERQILHCP